MRNETRHTLRAVICTLLSCGVTVRAEAQSGRSFALTSSKGDSVGTIVVRDSSIFTKFANEFGWRSPSLDCMAIADHPAVVTTPSDLESWMRHWLDSTKTTRASTEAPPGVVTTLTTDTQTIGGIRTRRVRVVAPQGEVDIWVAADEVPSRIRASAKGFSDLMPPDYWRRMHGSPGFSEIIVLYGVPIRQQFPDGTMIQASTPTSSIPAWVADVETKCKNALKR
jgi:hypothetical protein